MVGTTVTRQTIAITQLGIVIWRPGNAINSQAIIIRKQLIAIGK
jgi:hypothetical protein